MLKTKHGGQLLCRINGKQQGNTQQQQTACRKSFINRFVFILGVVFPFCPSHVWQYPHRKPPVARGEHPMYMGDLPAQNKNTSENKPLPSHETLFKTI